jgi:nitrate ABC transporter ATP-binding subunit
MDYLNIEHVCKRFGSGRTAYDALTGINLHVRRGEFVALIGHSGCGKSTLLNLIAGLSEPTAGALSLEGRPIAGPGPDRAMVFQHHGLLPWLSVHDNVDVAVGVVFAGSLAGQIPRRSATVERVLRAVGLWEHRHKKPGQISGGMRQRAAIARAFGVEPQLLLLDEPFGALDALTRAALQDELIALWSADRQCETVIMVTHDIDEAVLLADRVVVMTDGPAATIRDIVEVGLPRPRERRAVVRGERFLQVKDRLLALLTEGAAANRELASEAVA